MNKNLIYFFLLIATITGDFLYAQEQPNIVIIYVDDLGYGDIGVNGAIGVKTPRVDELAANGLNFTDAHSAAATCTPSRYALLTGNYAFRREAQILEGDAPLLIDPEQPTLPKMLQKAGYHTAVVGKWHLGLGNGDISWNERVAPGPAEVGFDYSFLIPATGDRVPCVYLENQRVVGLEPSNPITVDYKVKLDGYPVGTERPDLLKQHTDPYHQGTIINGISRIGYMSGGEEALWVDENIPMDLVDKATAYIEKQKEDPFFIYFSLHDIHQPRIANIKFVESSTMGPRGDVIAQMDWCVGEIVDKLKEQDLLENTLIIFTSDNGPILDDGYLDYADQLVGDHQPGGMYRGTKYSVYEAGTRMPTICHWPAQIKPGSTNALLSQVDLFASLAHLVGESTDYQHLDSEDHLQAWLGKQPMARTYLLEEAYTMGLRWDNWKYIQPTDRPVPGWIKQKKIDPGFSTTALLFDLSKDPKEQVNLADQFPEVVETMKKKLQDILENN